MIFYFSGTGNSLFAAKKLTEDNEELISMAEAVKSGKTDFKLVEGERVGFVFPVYFYTVPKFVESFIEKMEISNAGYVFAVITCGGGIAKAGTVLKKLLAKKGLVLSYVSKLLMPDNSMLFYQIPKAEEGKGRIAAAAARLEEIKKDISEGKTIDISNSAITSTLVGKLYNRSCSTKKFYADPAKCTSCGMCERNCPEQAIKIENGKPVWTALHCGKCSACINRCPACAIQYGKGTVKRNRYSFPG